MNSLILIFVLMLLDFHVLLSAANAWLAIEVLVLISTSVSPTSCHYGTQVCKVSQPDIIGFCVTQQGTRVRSALVLDSVLRFVFTFCGDTELSV